MTLPRTIHRREARKRAKARPKSTGRTFITPDWAVVVKVEQLKQRLLIANLHVRYYTK